MIVRCPGRKEREPLGCQVILWREPSGCQVVLWREPSGCQVVFWQALCRRRKVAACMQPQPWNRKACCGLASAGRVSGLRCSSRELNWAVRVAWCLVVAVVSLVAAWCCRVAVMSVGMKFLRRCLKPCLPCQNCIGGDSTTKPAMNMQTCDACRCGDLRWRGPWNRKACSGWRTSVVKMSGCMLYLGHNL